MRDEDSFGLPTWVATVLNTMSEGVLVLDQSLRITGVNRSARQLLGAASEELIGRQVGDLLQPAQRSGSICQGCEDPFFWLKNQGEAYFIETVFLRQDGRTVDLEISALALPQQEFDAHSLVLLADISERKENQAALLAAFRDRETLNQVLETAQGQLLQADKMASVGQLAAGVAHEINNPIGFVNSNLGSLKGQVAALLSVIAAYEKAEAALGEFPDLLEAINHAKVSADLGFVQQDLPLLIDESLEGVGRVKKIVDNLKDFSRVDSAHWQYASLESGLESTLNIVANEIKYKAEVIKCYSGLPEVECIPSQINQVLMNLLVNAAHAIEGHGTITLRTGFDEREVWIEVEDTGKGIPREHLASIFEPFFTTKPVGKGTGLGLSVAYGIVSHHHGKLVVASELGKGSVFRVAIPRTRVRGENPA